MATLKDYLEYEQPTKYIVDSDDYNDSYEIPVLTPGQTFILGYTNEKNNVFPKEKLPIILFDDFTTSTQFVDFPFKVKSSALKILHAKNNANIKFCYYLLKSININSNTHKRYWISEFENYKVRDYSVEEQEEIVSKLDLIKKAIDNRKKTLIDNRKYLNSKFYEIFGDINTNEKGFSIKKLSEIAKISSSKRIYAREYVESGIPFYRGTEITELSNGRNPQEPLYISEKRYLEIKDKYGVPQKGDILITAVGTVGNTWVVDNDSPFYYKDGNIIQIHLEDKMLDIYFKYALDSLIDDFKFHNVNGTSYSALTIDKFKTMEIIIPPYELQLKFGKIYDYIKEQDALIKKDINDLEKLFDNKINELFDKN